MLTNLNVWLEPSATLTRAFCSISLVVKRGVANAKSRVRVSYIAPTALMAQPLTIRKNWKMQSVRMDTPDCDKRVKRLPGSASGTSYILCTIGEKDITCGYGPQVMGSTPVSCAIYTRLTQ